MGAGCILSNSDNNTKMLAYTIRKGSNYHMCVSRTQTGPCCSDWNHFPSVVLYGNIGF